MKISVFTFVTLLVSVFTIQAFALECKDFEKAITLEPQSIDVGQGPQKVEVKTYYYVIQSDCSNKVFTASEYSVKKGAASLELQFSFSIDKLTSHYKYIEYPEINTMVTHTILGLFVAGALEIRDTSIQVNNGKWYPQDAFFSQVVFRIERDEKTKKWTGSDTDYTEKGIYGITYFSQK